MNQINCLPRNWRLLPLFLCSFLPAAFAQETTAGITGAVKDPTGAMISGASVEVSGAALIGTMKTKTDSNGAYRFSGLPAGQYVLTVSAPGFRTTKLPALELSAGRLPTIDVSLQVGAIAETVEVSDRGPIVDVTQSKVAVTVDRTTLDNLPKGRSFQSVIPFAAGARMEPMQGTTSSRENGFQIDGATDSENVYLVDGVNTTNIQTGGVGKAFQMDFIQEVQIKSSSFEAEFGGAIGGVINAVAKRGSNEWHGSVFSYLRSNRMNANDACSSGYTSAGFSTVCGLRLNPSLAGLNNTTRLDGTPEYYIPAKDQRNIIEPGFEVGGSLWKNRLWLFSSYIPNIDTTRRLTTFTSANPGPRKLTQTSTQHNAYNRLDFRVSDSLRLYGSWNYAYYRISGQLGSPDSANGQQLNAGRTTDPNTFRSDVGNVQPISVYNAGGDWTPNSRTVVTARYGYFYNNLEQRGIPTGTRYLYQSSVNANTRDLGDAPFPASSFNPAGFANIPSNQGTVYDAYSRKSISADVSYFVGHMGGSHTFKTGYFMARQQNDVLNTFQGGRVDLFFGQSYSPVSSTTICDPIKAANLAKFGKSACQGQYGYFVVGTGVVNTGGTQQTAKAFYVQDAWTVGHGLTLNLGVRFDQERQPPYDANRFPAIEFGWGQKIAPRIGGAYDVLHNGKVKVYASYGKFFDIMKMGLARGSFGSDYWHNCYYAMDDTNFTNITPSYPIGGGCPASGPAPGVTVGRFIENVDFRATKADPRDPAIQPDMKPMSQHEVVAGVDWAITPQFSLETRYAHKRLDQAIEDMSITDNLGFYIGNPGSGFNDFLHRPVVTPNDAGVDYLTTVPFCKECPLPVKPTRRYDSLEFRLAKRQTSRWYGSMSYTYSKLRGNYSGLVDTDPTDGGGGRHSPNNGRAFDLPTMGFLPNGQIDDGPLATDRPHTGKVFGGYIQKWAKMQTIFGINQFAYQGTPISTCLPVVGTSSACQWAEGRGNFVQFSRASNGDFVKGDVIQGARTDNFMQTDLNIRHEIPISENKRLAFEAFASNVFNQRAVTAVYQFAIPANLINPTRPSRFSGDPQVDWGKVMNGYNYVDALNGKGAFGGGVQTPLTLASRYGLPQVYQTARNLRLTLRFTF